MKKILLLFLICIIFITGCKNLAQKEVTSLVDTISTTLAGEVEVNSYTIYGRFFNLEGTLKEEINNPVLVFKSKGNEEEYSLKIDEKDGVKKFKTTEYINDGINLEKIKEGNYLILLKSEDEGGVKYYTLTDKSDYENLTYYTITRDNLNKKIDIDFMYYNDNSYLELNCYKEKLDSQVYDVVIDAGHGGDDPGATKNGYSESNINLSYAKDLKKALEEIGLKVKLTRESDVTVPTYGVNSRVGIPYETKAKLMLSIHQNSAVTNIGVGGVEVYTAYNSNTAFAESLAKNIVENTSTDYSTNKENKILPGVYLRTLKKSDLEAMEKTAEKEGYEPYPLATTNSTYYYIIRETGGVVTGSYVDDRNKEKPWNNYYNSNHGCESYLVEVGYINSLKNLNILLNEKDKYIEAIKRTIVDYLEI